MNDPMKSEFLDAAGFDRLVDGELSAAEYRALLAALDQEPDGWQRCAMAFLEAQAWRCEISGIRRGQDHATPADRAVAATNHGARRWLPLLAVAASFIVAFLGGLYVQQRIDALERRGGQLAQGSNPVHKQPAHEALRPEDEFLAEGQEPQSLGNIRLVVDGGPGNEAQPIDVPVYDLRQVGPQWLTQDRSILPPEVIEALHRRGRKVESQIQFLPLPLDEGRQIVLPVEQIQITPVSRRSY